MKNLISIVLNRTFAAVLLASAFVLMSVNTAFSIGVCTNITANSSASVAVGTNPRQVLTGDLNGDNFPDSVVLTGNSGSSNMISVLLNNGRGTLSNFSNLTTNISIGAIALGDFNLDGTVDIAAAASSSFSNSTPLFVYLGNGNGTFGTPSTSNFAGSAIALTKGDFNSDGLPDIAIANNSSSGGFGVVTLFLNAGFGSFNFAGNFPVSGVPRDIKAADFNGDNLQDVAVINTNNTGSLLLGTGTGSFQSASSFPLFSSSSSSSFNVSFAIGDLNNDTRPDLAVANGDTNILSVLINSGAGSFNPPSTITFADFNYRARSIVIGQYVGDANLDIAVTINSGFSDSLSAAVIVPGLGNGNFGTNLTITPTGSFPISIADGDFDKDGLIDLITANSGSGDVSVIINTANSRFGPRTFPTNGNPNQIVTTDFNGDGNLDYAVSNTVQNSSPNPNGIFISFGDGNGGVSGILSLSLSLTQALLTTDVNRDGRADLISISAGQSSNSVVNVYVNRGTNPIFGNPADQSYTLNFAAKAIVNGDFNNDGNVDLVVTSFSGNNTAILLGTNAGTFNPPSVFASPVSSAFVVADNFDADTDLDLLFIGTGFNGQSGVFTLLGNGNGTFSQVSEVFPVSNALTAVAADFNKDGKTDIAVTSGSSFSGGTSSLFVAFGDGDGTFTISNIYSAGLNPAFPSIADVNSDSFPDIVLANRTSNSITILLNNRNGTFRISNTFSSGIFPEAIVTGDFNNDGRVDFSTANRGGNNFSVILNTCREAVTKTDYDGDGKTNLAVFRPSNGTWYVLNTDGSLLSRTFGIENDIPTPGDYDGDGVTDFAVFRRSTGIWYILRSSTNRFYSVNWGLNNDIPVANDYDGDGRTDVAVFRPSNGVWYVLRSSLPNSSFAFQFGLADDIPVAGDYDGDGRADIAVYRDGLWIISKSSDSSVVFQQFGLADDKPTPGDYDGDGRVDLAVYRNGIWYILRSRTGTFVAVSFGLTEDIPQPGDYDGDGKTDIAVFRPDSSVWYVLQSSNGQPGITAFGISGDIPTASIYRY